MFLANHGAVCCGETVEEAFFNVHHLVLACENQVRYYICDSYMNVWLT
jgi:adducin